MLEFQFDIVHCKGSDNFVAHFFSRNFENETSIDNHNKFLIGRLMINGMKRKLLKRSLDKNKIPSIDFDEEIFSELNNLGPIQRETGIKIGKSQCRNVL